MQNVFSLLFIFTENKIAIFCLKTKIYIKNVCFKKKKKSQFFIILVLHALNYANILRNLVFVFEYLNFSPCFILYNKFEIMHNKP